MVHPVPHTANEVYFLGETSIFAVVPQLSILHDLQLAFSRRRAFGCVGVTRRTAGSTLGWPMSVQALMYKLGVVNSAKNYIFWP